MAGTRQTADIAVVGAGIIGMAIADALARTTSARIVVVDRGTPGCEASNAAAGLLAVASSRARRGVLFDLRCRSARLFGGWIETLHEETGAEVDYRRPGVLAVAATEAEGEALRDLVEHRRQQGFSCESLRPSELVRLEPGLSPNLCGGARFDDDAVVDSRALVSALVTAARMRGVRFLLGTDVRAVMPEADGVAVCCSAASLLAGTVVIAAGAWCADVLARAGVRVPLRPARGEMLAVDSGGWQPRCVVMRDETYVIGRPPEVWIGSTLDFVGFDRSVSAAGIDSLRTRAAELIPSLLSAPLLRSWAGLRPCPTIRRPIIGPLPGFDRIVLATGHHRSGVLLAPITAQLVAEIVCGAPPSLALHPFGYRRR
jgi:glycine oxidase